MSRSPKNKSIVFAGTPDFAVPSLKRLSSRYDHPCLVVTMPDRPKGRGRRIVSTPVKTAAADLGCPIIQPESINTDESVRRLRQLAPDFIVVAAYGGLLSKEVLHIPRLGTINLHASLLPKYRGPAPIQRAIINRETETGVTTMLMNEGLDTGDVLMTKKIPISPVETSATLHHKLAELGADLLIDTLDALSAGTATPCPQNHDLATYAPLIKKKDGLINWNMPARDLDAFIRAMTPWPGAYTFHKKNRFIITRAEPLHADASDPPGTVIDGLSHEIRIAAGNRALSVVEIQKGSGKRLLIRDFLNGYSLKPGDRFTDGIGIETE